MGKKVKKRVESKKKLNISNCVQNALRTYMYNDVIC